ncbi:MAG: class I SAM-dependent methyltransferase [Desulfobulbaceae bacterium]|nr:class I SAM-dependent methyltransferase [Desulfobulbaceae bacterium]
MSNFLSGITRSIRRPFNRAYALKRLREYHSRPRSPEEIVNWAMNFGGGGHYRIKTLQIPEEITALAEAVRKLQPKIIVEIGTASGGTLLIWSSIASEKVISCDLQDMTVRKELFEALPPPRSKCRVVLLSGDSHDPSLVQRMEEELAGRKADFLFIDGDHTEAGVTADFNDYRHLVRRGGIIAFHDIVARQPLADNKVHLLWQKIKMQNDVQELIADPEQSGFGIGIIRVR